jgi:sialic acid synthase SpsE
MLKNEIYIVSELCGQFGGLDRRVEQMMLQSKMGGANAVKIQLYDTYRMPGENRSLWEYLSITKESFYKFYEFSKKLNIDFFASPFHKDRFDWIIEANLKMNKIASLMLIMDFDLCKEMVNYKDVNNNSLPTFCSLGKWDKKELPFNNDNVVYMHCVAKYPHSFEEAMDLMPKKFEKPLLGYSDHSTGIESAKEAIKRGALFVEKHYTTDHILQSKTEGAHSGSMNYEQLCALRGFADEFNK